MKNIIKLLTISSILLISACSESNETQTFSQQDLQKVNKLHANYREYWLENDSAKVLSLFSENGALIPPGNPGNIVKGKKAIGNWWFFVTDSTTYPITDFVYLNDTLLITDTHTAIFEGVSLVKWNTQVGDSVISSSQSSSNFITICKKEDEEWKIIRQIWNVKPEK